MTAVILGGSAQGDLAVTRGRGRSLVQMVWESGCVVIVMLTPLSENGVRQCYHYWPDEGSNLYHVYEVPAAPAPRRRTVRRGPRRSRPVGQASPGPVARDTQAPKRLPRWDPDPGTNSMVLIFVFVFKILFVYF